MKKIIIILAALSILLGAAVVIKLRSNRQEYYDNAEYVGVDDKYQVVYDELLYDNIDNKAPKGSEDKEALNPSYYVKKSYEPYNIYFSCPRTWKNLKSETGNLHLEGEDGFLEINVLEDNGIQLETLVLMEVFKKGRPYGKEPKIFAAKMNGFKALTVIPSVDQASELNQGALCIMEYPKPITMNNKQYKYLVLKSIKSKISVIAKSVSVIQ